MFKQTWYYRFYHKRLSQVILAIVCLLGLQQVSFAEDYGFDYPLLFDWCAAPAFAGLDLSPLTTAPYGFHAVHDEITPFPYAGSYLAADDWRVQGCLSACYDQNRPVGILLRGYSAPYSGTVDKLALTKVMDYLHDNNQRFDYMIADWETAYDHEDILLAVSQVRNYPDPNINQAKLGNYAYFAGATNWSCPYPSQVDTSAMDTFYRSSGLNVSMPNIYQYEYYEVHAGSTWSSSQRSPNKRSALFWAPLENLSTAARNLPAGHQLIPWVGDFIPYDGYDADPLPHEDVERLMQHTRLRGADGYYMFLSMHPNWYDPAYPDDVNGNEAFKTAMMGAWQELDWLFAGVDKADVEVLNLATSKTTGFEWSAVETPNGVAVVASNLDDDYYGDYLEGSVMVAAGMDSKYVDLLFGSSGHKYLPSGTHWFESYVENIAPIAENDAYSVAEDNVLNVVPSGVLANDTDIDPDTTLTAIKTSETAHGSVTLNSDGSLSYTPHDDWHGTDTFTYKANDGSADSNTATVSVTVDPVPDLAIVDNGVPGTGLHSYTLTATNPGIVTLAKFTIEGEVHQVFDGENPSEWLGDNSASESETTDSYVIFGDLRLPDLGGETWPGPSDPSDKVTEEDIAGEGNSGMGTLNNYDDSLDIWDAYMKLGAPSTIEEAVDLMQLVTLDGQGFTVTLTLVIATDYDPITGESTQTAYELTLTLPSLTTGDADGNGYVDSDDVAMLAQNWLQDTDATWAMGDFNQDGAVNDIDATLLAANWNPQSASVPEPGALVLLTGILSAIGMRQRK